MIGTLPGTSQTQQRVGPTGRWSVPLLLLALSAMLGSTLPPAAPMLPSRLASSIANDERAMPPGLAGPHTSLPAPAPTMTLPPELAGHPEVVTARTADTATYDMGDGRFALVQGPQPLHYEDEHGTWQPIDPRFVSVDGGWRNDTNLLRVSIAERSSSARLAVSETGTGWEPQALLATTGDRERVFATPLADDAAQPGARGMHGQAVRFRGNWSSPQIADQWQSGPGSAEYTVLIPALPEVSGPRPTYLDLQVQLHPRPGTTIWAGDMAAALPLTTRGELRFVGSDGTEMTLQPPVAYEQARPDEHVAGDYRLLATSDPSIIELRARVPWRWLAAPERRFPVVLDPLFQVRSPTLARNAFYRNDRSFSDIRAPVPLEVGQYNDGVQRLLMRFALPTLPTGTRLDRAYVVATPTGVNFLDRDYLQANVVLHQLTNTGWATSPSVEPQWNPTPLPPGPQQMRYSRGQSSQAAVMWDVSALAASWAGGGGTGVMLRTANEWCRLNPNGCGGFRFDYPSTWINDELFATERASTPEAPELAPSTTGGLRLLVFYTGPELRENQVVDMTGRNPDAADPYYHADHEYRIPAVPSRWQAVVARGIGAAFGPPTPTDPHNPRGLPVRGSLPLELRSGNDLLPWADYQAATGSVGYVLINGRQNPAQGRDHRLRVKPAGGEPQPYGYDVRLLGERGAIAGSSGTSVVRGDSFNSGDPMSLWNIQLPAGTNSRVDVVFTGYNSHTFSSNTWNYVRNFNARLFQAGNSAFLTPNSPNRIVMSSNAPQSGPVPIPPSDNVRLTTGIFQPSGGNYALALQYDGPRMEIYTSVGGGEFPIFGVARLQYNYHVRVTSCNAAQGLFPTTTGLCQQVRCPTSAFPSANYRRVGDTALWSEAGWTQSGSRYWTNENAGIAPLVGGVFQFGNIRRAPTVAVVGGSLAYQDSTVTVSKTSTVVLVNCGAPSNATNPVPENFTVYEGPMRRVVTGNPLFGTRDELQPDTGGFGGRLIDPWPLSERQGSDLSAETIYVAPDSGTAGGTATLRRRTGNDIFFSTGWSLDYTGWPSLAGTVRHSSGAAPNVAGLILGLGTAFDLDKQPAGAKAFTRQFTALRAPGGRVTQPPELGGASKPVQVLILPRGVAVRSDPSRTCDGSCIDLRALDDTPDRPNRNWTLPDIHTNGQAQTVAFSQPGRVMAYSSDHPAAAPQAISQEFSFDTFGGKVSVTYAPCEPGGPQTVVISGTTKLSLPNIGKPGDAASQVTSGFKLCQTSLRSVHMAFQSPVGVPLGNSGLFVTGLSGTVDIFPDYTTIQFGIDMQAAQGNEGIAKVRGDVVIDTRGLVAFKGKVALLKGFVGGEGNLWVGWNPLDVGFKAQVCYPFSSGKSDPCAGSWISGMIRAHMWEGQGWQNRYHWLPDNNEKHIAAQITASLSVKKGQIFSWWFIDIPPRDISLGIELAFGQFCTNQRCTTYEWGIKGKLVILGYDIGLYYGFGSDLSRPRVGLQYLHFILGNDDHVLIDQYGGARDVPVALASSSPAEHQLRAPAATVNGTVTEQFRVSAGAENLLFGLGWQAGSPQLTLIRPDGVEIRPGNAATYGAQFERQPNSTLIGVNAPIAGVWRARIANLSEDGVEHYKFVYFANRGAPGTPENRGRFLAPAQPEEDGTAGYTIRWEVPAGAPATSTISLFYTRQRQPSGLPPEETDNLEEMVPIVKNLRFRTGEYAWDTSGLENGFYTLHAEVDDGINALPPEANPEDSCAVERRELPSARAFDSARFPGISTFSSAGTVWVLDTDAPTVAPAGVEIAGVEDGILARWSPVADRKTGGYLVRWGPRAGNTITVINQQRVTLDDAPTARINGLTNGVEYGVEVAAIRVNGNIGPFSAPVFTTPDTTRDPLREAPADLTVQSTTGTNVRLTWNAPPGPAPARYRVVLTRLDGDSVSRQVETTERTVIIGGLSPGATYSARVGAANNAGWYGGDSEPVRFVATRGDTNGDGLPDDWAAAYGISDPNGDADGDGLSNKAEFEAGTNPLVQNSDGDDFSDAEEVAQGTDPLDSTSYGTAQTQPRLTLAADHLVFRAKRPAGATIPAQQIAWTNTGGGDLALRATTTASWIRPTVNNERVRVAIDITGLRAGFYHGVVRLEPTGASDPLIGPPSCIRVEAWVSPADNEIPGQNANPVWLPLVRKQSR